MGGPGDSRRRFLLVVAVLAVTGVAWAGVSLLIASMANVGTMVGLGLEIDPFPAPRWTSFGGQLVGALILAVVGIVAALHIRSRCDAALARDKDRGASASS